MKMWIIPWPWDYHRKGKLIVLASTKSAALKKGRDWFAGRYPESWRTGPDWDRIFQSTDSVIEGDGCDD